MRKRQLPKVASVLLVTIATAVALLQAQTPAGGQSDLDQLMAAALKNRDDSWLRLHDYVLDERETFEILGGDRIPLHGLRREYSWSVREGYLVRRPMRSNGVAIPPDEQLRYEDEWLQEEKTREKRHREREAKKAQDQVDAPVGVDDVVRQDARSRFMSEAYFMRFPFEAGNYYLVGREELEGRPVLKVEYYPTRMFSDSKRDDRRDDADPAQPPTKRDQERRREREREQELEDRIERSMNKVTLITLWVDPEERQIVRFLFDNADWGFLPYRQIARVDDVQAEMTMGRYFDGVWLPKGIRGTGAATLATGTFRFTYTREFYDYRMGEVRARIRAYVPKMP
ncbi:MAG: hypothetical protein AB1806_05325 [Acidobacteriota bacterium]